MTSKLDRIIFNALLALITLLPFHAFLKTWLSSLLTSTNIDYLSPGSFLIGAWKEILIVLMGLLVLVKILKERRWPFRWSLLDYALILFSLVLLLSPLWTSFERSAYVWGLKTDLEFVALYFIVRSLPWNEESVKKFFKIFWKAVLAALVFALVLYFLLPQDFLQYFGYTPYVSSYVDEKPLPFLTAMGSDLSIARLAGTFSGPNQLGTYILIILGLLLGVGLHHYRFSTRRFAGFEISLMSLAALILTFSRAAWIGALIAFLIVIWSRIGWQKFWKPLALGIAALALISFSVCGSSSYCEEYLARESSTSGHLEKLQAGWEILQEHPWGLGLGQAGPVSRRLQGEEQGIVSESWYLQLAEEAGWPALLAWFLTLGLIFSAAWREKTFWQSASFFFMLAISIDGLFLHAWADSVTALTAFTLLAIGNTLSGNEEQTKKLKTED